MKFISVRDLRTKPAAIWKELQSENEMIITNNGKPIALLTPISDNTLEKTVRALRKSRAAAALQSMQKKSADTGKKSMSADDVIVEVKLHRTGK